MLAIKQYNAKCVRTVLQIALNGNESAIRQLCNEVDLAYESLEQPTKHIAPAIQDRLWLRLAERMNVLDLGLQMGQQLGTTWGGFVQLLSQVSPTLHAALSQFSCHKELFTDPVYYQTFALIDAGELSYFDVSMSALTRLCYPFYCRHTVEGMFVVALQLLRDLGKCSITPIRVDWQHPQPPNLDLYHTIFQAPMYFSQEGNRLYFRRSELNRRIVTHNPALLAHFYQLIETSRVERLAPLSERVRACLLHRLLNHRPISLEHIADDLTMAVRSLQRKLEQEDVIFHGIVECVRRELAFQLLAKKNHNLSEIAWLIGYEELSSFRRAFKRWTGSTPSHFDRQRSNMDKGL